jgi:hypothetical protein
METILESISMGGRTSPIPIGVANGARAGGRGGAGGASALSGLLGADGAAGIGLGPIAAAAGMPHAASFVDCETVLRQAAIQNPKPTAAPMAVVSGPRASELLQGGPVTAVQEDEDQVAQVGGRAEGGAGCLLGPAASDATGPRLGTVPATLLGSCVFLGGSCLGGCSCSGCCLGGNRLPTRTPAATQH